MMLPKTRTSKVILQGSKERFNLLDLLATFLREVREILYRARFVYGK